MKTPRILLAAATGLAVAFAAFASDSSKPAPRVEVLLSQPADKYVDVRDGFSPTEKGQAANLEALQQDSVQRATPLIAADQKLTVTLTEVDMAGDFEPWGKPGMEDVRIIKDIYPPRIDVEFKLTGADGTVIKEGKKQLRDLAFMMKLSINRDDAHRFEKELLNDWLRSEFKAKK